MCLKLALYTFERGIAKIKRSLYKIQHWSNLDLTLFEENATIILGISHHAINLQPNKEEASSDGTYIGGV